MKARTRRGAVGIGTLIVFIAMVLVAAVAAAVLINTSGFLQQKASSTGRETTQEVASGIQVERVVGKTDAAKLNIQQLAIYVSPNAGSAGIDLRKTRIIISDGSQQAVLNYKVGDGQTTISNGTNSLTIGDGQTITITYDSINNQVSFSDGTTTVTVANGGTIQDTETAMLAVADNTIGKGYIVVQSTITLDGTQDVGGVTGTNDLIITDQYGNQMVIYDIGSGASANVKLSVIDSAYTPASLIAGGVFASDKLAWLGLSAATDYGIIVIQDADNSVQPLYPTINKGDMVALTFYVGNDAGTAIFGQGIQPRTKITGKVVPEFGAPGVIEFTTPTSYTDEIIELQ